MAKAARRGDKGGIRMNIFLKAHTCVGYFKGGERGSVY